jgi:hypothetical protein
MKRAIVSRRLRRAGLWAAAAGALVSLAVTPPSAFCRSKHGATVTLYCGADIAKGELIGIRADAIVILSEKDERAVPLTEIDKIKVSRGLNKTGAIVGTVAGAVAGAVIAGSRKPAEITGDNFGEIFKQVAVEGIKSVFRPAFGAFVGGTAGGLLGMAAGTLATKDVVIVLGDRPADEARASLDRLRKKARVPNYR